MKNLRYVPLSEIKNHIGEKVITEGSIEIIYPIKEDILHNYIFLDSMSPVQRSIYMVMNTTSRKYIVSDGKNEVFLLNAPLSLVQGQHIIFVAKVIQYRGRAALRFKKIL